jgi:hypothetical protein
MNIGEALKRSKETGESFMRDAPGLNGWTGWIAYEEGHVYRMAYEDLVADDWVPAKEKVDRMTKGRWSSVGRLTPDGRVVMEGKGK